MHCIHKLLTVLLLVVAGPAAAVLEIQITQGVEGATPIAVVPFAYSGSSRQPEDISAIVAADLRRSGKFSPLSPGQMPQLPASAQDMNASLWRERGVQHVVLGRLDETSPGRYTASFQLLDAFQGGQRITHSIPTGVSDLRKAAHKISDLIYEALTGTRGAFSARIAYITVEGQGQRRYALQIADSDGYNPFTVVSSGQPMLSPSWSPDGRKLAYVSFENKRPEIFVQNLNDGSRTKVSGRAGLNSAPAWSPDGSTLAVTLSTDGNPDIYAVRLSDQSLRRLTEGSEIDTEPVWTPDGSSIIFTSDRSGQPQLYRMSAQGGRPERLSFEGAYNAAPDVSSDGRMLAMVTGANGRYRIALMDLNSGAVRILTEGFLDESPSFAPNGSMIIYATEYRGRGVLAAVSEDGRFKQQLVSTSGEVREPVWSPYPGD